MFISFEGIGGVGKTTQASLLENRIRDLGMPVVGTRDPGGTAVGERIRALLLSRGHTIGARAEAALFAAARAQLVEEVLRPALADGSVVITDRFLDSSIVYQGELQALGVAEITQLNALATRELVPDLTLLLLVDPEVAQLRRSKVDPIEPQEPDRRRRLHDAYIRLAEAHTDRIVPIDGSATVSAVADKVHEVVFERLIQDPATPREVRERLRDRS